MDFLSLEIVLGKLMSLILIGLSLQLIDKMNWWGEENNFCNLEYCISDFYSTRNIGFFGMSTVNRTIFMWYLTYNSLAFDSSMKHGFYDD